MRNKKLVKIISCVIIIALLYNTLGCDIANPSDSTNESGYESEETQYDELERHPDLLGGAGTSELPEIIDSNMSHLKGFNITNFLNATAGGQSSHNYDPKESDFQYISELGFNFARIAFDYAFFTYSFVDYNFDPVKLKKLDDTIMFARKHNVHVMLAMHSAPGHSLVRRDFDGFTLFSNREQQEAFINQWKTLAERYKGIPNSELSFNLLNEPNSTRYEPLALEVVKEIRKIDPDRLIISDSMHFKTPAQSLLEFGVVTSTRGYYPSEISHYRASWIDNSFYFPRPSWPLYLIPGTLDANNGESNPWEITFEEPLKSDYSFGLKISQVSNKITLKVYADEMEVGDWDVVCTDGEGKWSRVELNNYNNLYENHFDYFIYFDIPQGTKKITVKAFDGGWVNFYEGTVEPVIEDGNPSFHIPLMPKYKGTSIAGINFDKDNKMHAPKQFYYDRERVEQVQYTESFVYNKNGGQVFVGEFGVHNYTPHQATLDFIRDLLEIYKENDWGWALWNLRGEFGILDNGRTDAETVDFHGHKLDVKMHELLKSYVD